ncbi:creatininase family protein [Sodalis ligni]|jgi:creatinine amidohydrolase|uniref:Creatinine amidohydrolase n=1 Tax=Sodalis ligni TaxID=2697027 RepID=A0A4R1NGF3_9GAMM|nr:creatininase family protein [Sodalis ligni]TCL06774.1 creatinine amidohydrolase [Sodalis ligni]
MKISDMNWQQVENYLSTDDRAIVPLGSTEQHAFLSLSVDSILAEKISTDAAEAYGIPVFPVLPFGMTPAFSDYPGTISLSMRTYTALLYDILNSLKRQGFRRILLVNGHGGNSPAQNIISEWMVHNPEVTVQLHNWWNAPLAWAKVTAIDPVASHASWMENFPWTRLAGVAQPDSQKPMVNLAQLRKMNPTQARSYLGDGNYGGYYQRPDHEMLAIWQTAIDELRQIIESL